MFNMSKTFQRHFFKKKTGNLLSWLHILTSWLHIPNLPKEVITSLRQATRSGHFTEACNKTVSDLSRHCVCTN